MSSNRILDAVADMRAALGEVASANPVFLSTEEKAEAIIELGRIEARVEELRLRVLAVSQNVADQVGAKDPGTWLIAQALTDGPAARAQLKLAHALDAHEPVRAGLATGSFTVEHARAIIRSLNELPGDLAPDVAASAERDLCQLATQLRPADLRRCGRHILHTVAPETADAEDAKAIQRLEAAVADKVRLSITPQGDGTSRVHAVVPEATGERLRILLESFAQPRITALETDGTPRPRIRVMADAFAQILKTVDPEGLPDHGGDSTTVVVTIGLDQLRRDLGIAELADLDISAAEARRLACNAKIIPLVLGGRSEPLDIGRSKRLHTRPQRKVLRHRDRHCRAESCTVPATWCQAHHDNPWSQGGKTSVEDGSLLCGHHHQLEHDPRYHTTRLPDGRYRFRLRT